jgi:ribonuclease J
LVIPSNLIIDVEQTKKYKPEQILIVSTGTQGEPMSALTRMASGEFNKVIIGETDTVVISASVIPGNERMIYNVINNLYKKNTYFISLHNVLSLLYSFLNRYFIRNIVYFFKNIALL